MTARIILAALGTLALAAAPADIVSWKLLDGPGRPVKPGGHFTVRLTANVQPGWRIFSMKPGPEGPIATRIWITEGQPFLIAGAIEADPPQITHDPNLNKDVATYEGQASFVLPIRVPSTTNTGSQILVVSAAWQACDSKACLPAQSARITMPIDVER